MKIIDKILITSGLINIVFALIYGFQNEYAHASYDLLWAFMAFYLAKKHTVTFNFVVQKIVSTTEDENGELHVVTEPQP